ncbi:MAG: hypothetical protein Kow001_23030 [Acidobacteriota bacterium]
MKDLICLVADKNMEAAMTEILKRHESLGIREITAEVVVHPRRDPGVFREGVEFVHPLQDKYLHGLLLLDAAWEGAPPHLQEQLEGELARASLDDWARAIVIDPELEAWVWGGSPHVEEALGWSGRRPALRAWLEQNGLWAAEAAKPREPKTAVERALWQVRKPRSSAIYRTLAQKASVEQCRDSAFLRLRRTLREWFG